MTTVALLRRPISRGVSTWRFVVDHGQYFAVSNRAERKYFRNRAHLDRAVESWRRYGYTTFQHAVPVKRGARQLILELAPVAV